ncbi:hypothetical protein IF1G_09908 [Cordyceps javanica]|uniref:Uncharacterized protein n=1 Tax=Cordyceps javanica TaxID=43265 RepID=A0A545UPP4_9HYPO|nr:hypothetical protein IF1G_09908 [Cordyceps javanica]
MMGTGRGTTRKIEGQNIYLYQRAERLMAQKVGRRAEDDKYVLYSPLLLSLLSKFISCCGGMRKILSGVLFLKNLVRSKKNAEKKAQKSDCKFVTYNFCIESFIRTHVHTRTPCIPMR